MRVTKKKKIDYSTFLIFTSNETEIQQNSSTQFVGIQNQIPDENTETNTLQNSDLGIGKFSLKFNPNVNNQVDYEILGRLTKEKQDQNPYILSEIDWDFYRDDLVPFEGINSFDRNGFLEILKKYLDSAQIASDWDVLKKAREEVLVNSLSMLCPFEPEEKQVLLEAETIVKRLDVLVTLMKLSSENDLESRYVQ